MQYLVAVIALGAAWLSFAGATNGVRVEKRLIVGTKEAPPFAMKNPDGTWSGVSIELWRAIANELNYSFKLRELDLQGLLDQVAAGKIDAAVAALTITAERERSVDFTQPFYTTGLAIAVSRRGGGGWFSFARALFSWNFLQVVALLTVVLLGLGILIWFFERKHNTAQFGGTPARGIFSGIWWAVVTMTTVGYGDKAPVTTGGRVVAMIWMFVGLIAISTFIATVTSALTVTQLTSPVRGPKDLPHVRVGTVDGTTAATYLKKRRAGYRRYETPAEGLRALAAGKIDAVVYDEPILRYLILNQFRQELTVLPHSFEQQYYGIALPSGSPLREPINRVLLEKTSEAAWQDILTRYLGNAE
jgi:polar amino acid transport system substrate-binding protein